MIQERLNSGERVTLNYGKLMERLLTMKIMREGVKQRYGQRTPGDMTKAPFFQQLLPLAESLLKQIRYVLTNGCVETIVVLGILTAQVVCTN